MAELTGWHDRWLEALCQHIKVFHDFLNAHPEYLPLGETIHHYVERMVRSDQETVIAAQMDEVDHQERSQRQG